ncbi:unnamed protein product [Nippostrongylus brasiliensis]|uniref:Reverse transcriptase domain-containing protein n=1 Tax=Nippostrongylus brasiliensis TaxID=27835 RepID=A0A0N4YAM6_NIPBR|nr:unnamed protein product [Nippostrongylus brasiliensis]
MFLDKLRKATFRRYHVMEPFDVMSMYTNVSSDNAVQAIFELLSEHCADSVMLDGPMLRRLCCVYRNVDHARTLRRYPVAISINANIYVSRGSLIHSSHVHEGHRHFILDAEEP